MRFRSRVRARRPGHTPIATRVLILITLFQGGTLLQGDYLGYTVNGTATGVFGGVDVSGWFSADLDNSSVTVAGTDNSAYQYSYTFTGALNGPGYKQTSKIPGVPCIVAGCPEGGTEPPGAATLNLFPNGNGLASIGFEDTGELFAGYANLVYGLILTDLQGGSSSAPLDLSSSGPVAGITATLSAETSESYYDFQWGGGAFSATGTVDGASSGASYLFSTGGNGSCTSGGTATLNSGDNFTGTIAIANLPAGQYCIGIDTNSLTDPDFLLTFDTPVAGVSAPSAVPEPSGLVLPCIGLMLIGWHLRARRSRRPHGSPAVVNY